MGIHLNKISFAILAVATLLATAPAAGQTAELINDTSGGIVEITDERELLVSGLQGHVSVRLGRAGEMQYMARLLSNRPGRKKQRQSCY